MIVSFEETPALRKSWNAIIKRSKDQIAKELKKVQLFEHAGSAWKGVSKRHKQVDINTAFKLIEKEECKDARGRLYPNLIEQHEESPLLEARHGHFVFSFSALTQSAVDRAYKKLCKREGLDVDEDFAEELYWSVDSLLTETAWLRLHSSIIEDSVVELEYQCLLAGYLPIGPDSSNRNKCRFLFA